jgi:hypothetical protein
MCKAFSGLITKSGKVYWEMGLDSHDQLQDKFVKKNPELRDDKLPPDNTFARFEIVPENNDYFSPNKWVFQLDEEVKPSWWADRLEKPCFVAKDKWLKKLYSLVKLDEIRKPLNPLIDIPERKRVTKKDLAMLKEWASVWTSVWASVEASVGASVWASVWTSVRASVEASVWASVGAYFGSLFIIDDWKYIDWRKKPFNRIGKGNYPFRSGEYLWRHGLVSSIDSQVGAWRLHTGPKAKVIWEGKV